MILAATSHFPRFLTPLLTATQSGRFDGRAQSAVPLFLDKLLVFTSTSALKPTLERGSLFQSFYRTLGRQSSEADFRLNVYIILCLYLDGLEFELRRNTISCQTLRLSSRWISTYAIAVFVVSTPLAIFAFLDS